MADLDAEFVDKISPGTSSSPVAILAAGPHVKWRPIDQGIGNRRRCGPSFARIFYRNAINIGFPIFESSEAFDEIDEGMKLGSILPSE
jgi:3-isopropylmalate/(R)-2-methylmalate dehydratase small subunit